MTYSADLLERLYRMMLRIRTCEEALVKPIMDKDIHTPCHLYAGQEAVAAGVCAALEREDYVFGNHRSHGHYLAKGGSMRSMLAEIYCRENGCSRGRGGSMHMVSPENGFMGSAPVVAGTIPLAVGAALASVIRGDKRVTVSFFGDGAAGEGVFYESLNFAALKSLPVMFVCENNFYATHMPVSECRVRQPIFRLAEPFNIAAFVVDGNDVLETYETSVKAVDACRKGAGPVFIEARTYRLRGHVGPDDNIQGMHTDIRPPEELESWMDRDPVAVFRKALIDRCLFSNAKIESMEKEVMDEVAEAVDYAERSPVPCREELEKYVFA